MLRPTTGSSSPSAWQGLARRLGPPARARPPRSTAVRRARHRDYTDKAGVMPVRSRRCAGCASPGRPPHDHGYDVPTAARDAGVPCSACGLSKRHLFDEAAREGGYDAVVTGHNLDDEAAVLFGYTLRWDVDALARQLPVLPAGDGFPRRSSRSSVSPSARRPRGASSVASTTRSRSARWPPATGTSPTRRCSTSSRRARRERRRPSTSTSSTTWRRCSPARRAAVDGCRRCSRSAARRRPATLSFCRLVEVASAHEPVPVEMLPPAEAAHDG